MSFVVARLVTALPEILDRPRRYWVHTTWAVATIGNVVLSWWSIFQYREVTWTLFRFLLFVAPAPCMLFVAAALAPDEPSEVGSWREHYFRVYRKLIGATLLFWLIVMATNAILLEGTNTIGWAIAAGGFLLLLTPPLLTTRPQVHGFVAIVYLLFIFGFMASNPSH